MDEKNKNIAEFLGYVDKVTAPMAKEIKFMRILVFVLIGVIVYLAWPMPSSQVMDFREAKDITGFAHSQVLNGKVDNK